MKKKTLFEIKTKDKAKQFIIQKIYEGFVEENPQMEEDILKLCNEIVFFNLKWGTKIKP